MKQAVYSTILGKIGDKKYVSALFFTTLDRETKELLESRSVVFVQDSDIRTPGGYLEDTFDLVVEDASRPETHSMEQLAGWAVDGGYLVLYGGNPPFVTDICSISVERVEWNCDQTAVYIVHKETDGRKAFQCDFYTAGLPSNVMTLYVDENETVDYDKERHQLVRTKNGAKQILSVVKDKEITTLTKASDLSLNVSQQCNMRCRYCFVDSKKISVERVCEKNMSFETADQSIRWYKAFKGGPVRISLFGGEPLMQMYMVKRLIRKYKQDNEVAFSLVTNATLMDDELIHLCTEKEVDLFVSLDGDRNQNDLMRLMANGSSAHDLVLEKMRRLPTNYFRTVKAMMTVTKYTQNLYDSIRYVMDCGFTYLALSFIKGNESLAETKEDLQRWDEDISRLSAMAYEGWLNRNRLIEPFASIYDNILYRRTAAKGCVAGKEMLFVQPDGCLSPCYRFVTHIWGDVFHEGIDREKQETFLAYKPIYRGITCSHCWANRFCQGGCTKDLPTDLKIKSSRCGFYQTILKRSLMVYAKNFDENWSRLKKIYRDLRYSDLVMARQG